MRITNIIYKLSIGALFGGVVWLAYGVFMPSIYDCDILYVAQDEIMQLEQDRVKNESLENRQLFYGEIETAIELATSLPQTYESNSAKVVYSMNSVTGHNVKSISKQIHQQIIQAIEQSRK